MISAEVNAARKRQVLAHVALDDARKRLRQAELEADVAEVEYQLAVRRANEAGEGTRV